MATFEVNVEFGPCSFKHNIRKSMRSKSAQDSILQEDIRSGKLYFDEHRFNSKHIPFMLTPYSVDMCGFSDKLFYEWELPFPKIVLIAISETEDSPSNDYRKISRKLVKGLMHALNTTEMWLCTDGLDNAFSRDIGEAFANEVSRRRTLEKGVEKTHSAFPDVALVGICRRDILSFNEKFGESNSSESEEHSPDEKRDINRNYGYFVFVKDTTDKGNGVSKFLLNFAAHISVHGQKKKKGEASNHDAKTPVIALLLHGKISQLDLVLGHVKKGFPLIIFKGSGGLADLLSYAYHQFVYRPEDVNIAEYTESLKPQVSDKLRLFHPNLSDYTISFLTEKIFNCIRCSINDNQEFITILNLSDIELQPTKLPHILLKALFKSHPPTESKGADQMKKDVYLAMDWNSAEVARTEVFTRDRSTRFHVDGKTFFRALTKPHREDFVSLFLSQGFQVHSFLDNKNLLRLFQNSLNKEFFKVVVWESIFGYGANIVIQRDFLDGKLNVLIEELTAISSLIKSYELDWNCARMYDDRTMYEAERAAMAALIIWATLSYRIPLVKTLWRHSDQPIHIALTVSIILRKLEFFVTDMSLKYEMDKQAKEFSVMASTVLTLCFEKVPCRALDLLNERSRTWSNKGLMEIAAFARNKMFLAQPSCQKYLDNLFMGKIKVRDLTYGDMTAPLWLKITLSTFLIFPMFLWIKFETPKKTRAIVNRIMNPFQNTEAQSTSPESQSVREKRLQKVLDVPITFLYRLYYLWTAPISKFWGFQIFYLFFLMIFSLAVIWPACGNIYLDFFTCVWLSTIIVDSTYHTYKLSKQYTSMPLGYRILESAFMILFIFAYGMSRIGGLDTRVVSPYNAKVMMCVALLYFYYRLIFISLPISPELGPMLYRVKRMTVVDFSSFIRVTILIVIVNGIVIHATVFPDHPITAEMVRTTFFNAVITFFLAPAAEYIGDPDPKCISLVRHPNRMSFYGLPENVCKVGRYFKPSCPNPGVWPYLFALQYFIILRLIVLPLLFALFSNTARKLEEQGKYIWKYQRYELVINFANRVSLPPPLCIFSFAYLLGKYVYEKLHTFISKHILKDPREEKRDDGGEKLDEGDFRYWRKLATQQFNKDKQEKEEEMTIKKRMERMTALGDALHSQRMNLAHLEGHLNELQIEITNAHQYLQLGGIQASFRERLAAKNVLQIFSRISPYPNTVVSRFPVSDNHVSWKCAWSSYDPIAFSLPKDEFPSALRSNVDIDIQRLREIEGEAFTMPHFNWNEISISPSGFVTDRKSWIVDKSNNPVPYELDSEDLPRNPNGRTGLKGRGKLQRWGPNHYMYIAITRWHDVEFAREAVKHLDVILMKTTDDLGLPGGYVSIENRYDVIRSLFVCKSAWEDAEEMTAFFENLKSSEGQSDGEDEETVEFLSERVKLGYMDEDVNTDQAWCEAEVWHYHYNVLPNVDDACKPVLEWYKLNDETLRRMPIGQAALLHSIAKKMKAITEDL